MKVPLAVEPIRVTGPACTAGMGALVLSWPLCSREIPIPGAVWEALLPAVFSSSPYIQFPASKESPKLCPVFFKKFSSTHIIINVL